MTSTRSGFTIVELIVAIVVLVVGLMAMLSSAAFDTRSVMRERNIDFAAIYAARRLEMLRISACRRPVDSSEVLMRGADTLAVNTWSFGTPLRDVNGNIDGYRIRMTSNYFKAPTPRYGDTRAYSAITRRTDTLEAAISCAS